MIRVTVVVQGRARFPIDMLRYDGVVPAREQDSAAISGSIADRGNVAEVEVHLARNFHSNADAKSWQRHWPTSGRWKSFGWAVVSIQGVTS